MAEGEDGRQGTAETQKQWDSTKMQAQARADMLKGRERAATP